MNKKCMGCGVVLQNTEENSLGYTPDINNKYCQRCFRLKNYGELKRNDIVNTKEIINKVNKSLGIAFFLIDYLNINKETISYFKSLKIEKVLVLSKCDTLRKEMKKSKIINWLRDVYNISEDVLFISNKSNYESSNIIEYLKKKKINTAFIMGITNAGKSTFINSLIDKRKEVLVSDRENTTLDFIKLKVGDYTLYDTPGFSYTNLSKKIIKKEIKPISYVIKENTSIVINNSFKIYFKDKNKVVLYLNIPIVKKEYKKGELNYKEVVLDNRDIVLPGLGFINIKDKGEIETNFEIFEIRKDISGDEF